ncbi:MAG: glycosyltransferase family 4 protein [Candidatus Limnocylindrales bacterium]
MSALLPRLRIAQVAPPIERVPPVAYGGTERVIDELARELARRGHEVVLFASGESEAPGELAATVPVSLRADGYEGDPGPWFVATQLMVLARQDQFDLIHGHLEMHNVMLARAASTPVVSTFHGRLDMPHARSILAHESGAMVAISQAQADDAPEVRWAGIVHNGLTLRDLPFGETGGDDLCFVGRFTPEKGLVEAVEVARLSGRRLRIAAKEPWLTSEKRYYDEVFAPAAEGADIELLGELGPVERDALLASSRATLMPGDWPEPFGLTAIESMATGTPVICRPVGGLQEIVRDGVDGFLASDAATMAAAVERVSSLDRAAIRRSVLERFSAERMADGYEAVYARVLAERGALVA